MLRLNNLKATTAIIAKISVFICVEAIIYILLYNLHDCTFNPLMSNVPHHIETSQLIYSANQLTDF